ncbi:MAG: hypothetical protein R3F59_36540 [Myxococcota bacterium]
MEAGVAPGGGHGVAHGPADEAVGPQQRRRRARDLGGGGVVPGAERIGVALQRLGEGRHRARARQHRRRRPLDPQLAQQRIEAVAGAREVERAHFAGLSTRSGSA